MKKYNLKRNVIALCLATVLVLAGSGCGKKLTSDPGATDPNGSEQTTLDPLSFAYIDSKIRDYTFGINNYMKDHSDEAYQKVTNGQTLNGVAGECTYTKSPDGKFESLQMMKTLENATQVDEYFNMGDSIFITRTTVYNDGNFDPVDKYYIIDGGMYKVDNEASTVTKVADLNDAAAAGAKKTELDLYLSFDEIRTIYA